MKLENKDSFIFECKDIKQRKQIMLILKKFGLDIGTTSLSYCISYRDFDTYPFIVYSLTHSSHYKVFINATKVFNKSNYIFNNELEFMKYSIARHFNLNIN